MTPQVKPVPGTINPTYVTGRISPVSGFTARRPCAVVIGRKRTGGLPPHLGSKRSNVNADDSPFFANGRSHLYMRTPRSTVSLGLALHVSCTYHAHVFCQRSSGTRPIDSV